MTALSVESWPGVLQMIQKYIKGWKVGLEAEMRFSVSEAYSLPMNAKYLVGSVMANLCRSHNPLTKKPSRTYFGTKSWKKVNMLEIANLKLLFIF